ncbi:hypothetical protein J6590_012919 [Homalodisca vitripennis]|nr:hypothetical protein J6590_012919 [Homalodisca vitripennis]
MNRNRNDDCRPGTPAALAQRRAAPRRCDVPPLSPSRSPLDACKSPAVIRLARESRDSIRDKNVISSITTGCSQRLPHTCACAARRPADNNFNPIATGRYFGRYGSVVNNYNGLSTVKSAVIWVKFLYDFILDRSDREYEYIYFVLIKRYRLTFTCQFECSKLGRKGEGEEIALPRAIDSLVARLSVLTFQSAATNNKQFPICRVCITLASLNPGANLLRIDTALRRELLTFVEEHRPSAYWYVTTYRATPQATYRTGHGHYQMDSSTMLVLPEPAGAQHYKH